MTAASRRAGPANAGFLVPFKCFTWVYAGEPAKAIQSLEKLVSDIDGFGAGKDQVLNAKVFALTNAAHDRDVQRTQRRRGARARDAHGADAREREAGGHGGVLEDPGSRRSRSSTGSWRPGAATTRAAAKLAQKTADLVAGENNARKMEPYHELLGLIALRQKSYKKAVTELRLADQTQLHNKYLLAQALEATNGKDEALELYKEVAENNFNTVDFALLRAQALKKVG